MNRTSNRTLIELNHDFCPQEPSELLEWATSIRDYMRTGETQYLPEGITFKHMRHHSEPEPLAASPAEGPTQDTGIRCACCNCEGVKELLAKLAAEGPKPGPRDIDALFEKLDAYYLSVSNRGLFTVTPSRKETVTAMLAQFFPARAEGDAK